MSLTVSWKLSDQELWVPNPNSEDFDRTVEYGYDQDGLITAINLYDQYWNMVAPWMSITYDPTNGRLTNTSFGNISTSQNYNSSGALSYFETDFGGSSIFQTSYQRDSLNRISILTEVNQGQMTVKKYSYDISGRLESVWRNDTLISTYLYDPNGNRISHWTKTRTDSGSYDAQDRMLTYGNAQYVYSKNGELQEKIVSTDTTRYVYDYLGNLITVVLPTSDRIDYIIDGQNRRIGKKLNGVFVKRWIYSGQLSPVAELDSANNVVSRFVGSYMIKSDTTYRFITDHLGSVRMVINVASGEIVERTDYDEFGNILERSEIPTWSGQPFAYAGGSYDTQTKLVRFGARDYNASVGRWTNKDPIGFGGNSSNFYEYIYLDPINFYDPSGLQGIGFGVSYAVDVGNGNGFAKAQQGFAGYGKFAGKNGNPNEGLFSGSGKLSQTFNPCKDDKNGFAAGAFAGAGLFGFLTNAHSVSDISGVFDTWNLNIGEGLLQGSVQLALGEGGTWMVSFGVGVGGGGSFSNYTTNTNTHSTGR